MTVNLIETLKTSIYTPKHPQNTKIHDHIYKKFKKSQNTYFQRN